MFKMLATIVLVFSAVYAPFAAAQDPDPQPKPII